MRWFTIGLLTAALGIFPTASAAADKEPETVQELVQAVEATYQDVHSLRADFVQVRRDKALGDEARQKGKVHLRKPRQMRWEFSGPDAPIVVSDGERIWIYTPAYQQVIETEDLNSSGGGIVQLLDNLAEIDEHFEITLLEKNDGGLKKSHEIELVPKQEAPYKRVRLSVTRKKYALERVIVVDLMDNETELSFSQVKFNLDFPDTTFQFEPPEGVQVIKSTL